MVADDVKRMEALAASASKAVASGMNLDEAQKALASVLNYEGQILPSKSNIKERVLVSSIRTKCNSEFYFLINVSAAESGQLRRISVWSEKAPVGYPSGLDSRYSVDFDSQRNVEAREALIEEMQRLADVAQAELKKREDSVLKHVRIVQRSAKCTSFYLSTCRTVEFSLAVSNLSKETIVGLGFGWNFPLVASDKCPSELSEKKVEDVRLGPGETAWVVINASDGPPTKDLNYCISLTGAKLPK